MNKSVAIIHDRKIMSLKKYNKWILIKENANKIIKVKIMKHTSKTEVLVDVRK